MHVGQSIEQGDGEVDKVLITNVGVITRHDLFEGNSPFGPGDDKLDIACSVDIDHGLHPWMIEAISAADEPLKTVCQWVLGVERGIDGQDLH